MRNEANGQFEQIDFTEQDLSKSAFTNCNFTGCDFSHLDLRESAFTNCSFTGCDLSCADFPGAAITDCNFAGCDFAITTYRDATVANSIFVGCDLSQVDLSEANIQNCEFTGCDLTEADFEYSNASHLKFTDCDLSDITGLDFFDDEDESLDVETQSVEIEAEGHTNGPSFAFVEECTFEPLVRVINEGGFGTVVGMGLRWNVAVPTIFRDKDRFIFVETTPWYVIRITTGMIQEDGVYDDQLEWNLAIGASAELTTDSFRMPTADEDQAADAD